MYSLNCIQALPDVYKRQIQYIVEEVVASGIEDVLIITGRNKSSIEEHFDRAVELEYNLENTNKEELLKEIKKISKMINIHTVRQKDPLGLGHAVYCAKAFVGNEPFAVLLGDDVVDSKKPCLAQMLEVYEEYKASILGVQPVEWEQVHKYGIVSGAKINERIYSVNDLVEKPDKDEAPTNIAILGRYISVSYTHLDVYKRQVFIRDSSHGFRMTLTCIYFNAMKDLMRFFELKVSE